MLVMSKGALSAAQAETYYEEKYSQDDYYTEKRGVVGQWFGRRRHRAWARGRGRVGGFPRRAARPAAFNRRGYSPHTPTAAANAAPDGTRPSTRPSLSASKRWLTATRDLPRRIAPP